jgi:class 3 adenylate cyclase
VGRNVWSPDYPWGVGPEHLEIDELVVEHWGTIEGARIWAEGEAQQGRALTEDDILAWAKLSSQRCTPDVAGELLKIWYETDIRSVLPSVNVPALLLDQEATPSDVEEVQYVYSLLPHAEFKSLPKGRISSPDVLTTVVEEIRRFVGVEPPMPELDTVLATVLFTDIVGSTEKQSALGGHAWKELIQRHDALVREALQRWRGVEVDTAGDGFYATFDGPARAIRCALDITGRVQDLGIQVRAGIHTGECELVDGKCAGITVSIGARVASKAGPSEVLISQTVKDLVAGSGFMFEDAGEHELKGVPERWRLLRVAPPS